MRILFITRKFPPSVGGMEVYSKELFEALIRCGAQVTLYRPQHDLIGRPNPAQMIGFVLRACCQLLRARADFDVVLLGDYALACLAIPAKLFAMGRLPVAVSLHGNDLYFMRQRSVKARIYRWISRAVVRSGTIDHAFANSRAIRDEALLRGIDRVSVVPLATVIPATQPERERRPAVLFAGRLIRYKGLSWFVRHVWPHIDPRLELLVAGTVWDQEEKRSLDGAQRTTYLGQVPYDLLPALRASVVACIMPNLPPELTEQDEGFGLAALEAPAVGTPIVAAACGGIPDAVMDGVTGFLLCPLDAQSWIECLNGIARWTPTQYDAFATQAKRHLMAHYNWDLVARRTLDALDTMHTSNHAPVGNRR